MLRSMQTGSFVNSSEGSTPVRELVSNWRTLTGPTRRLLSKATNLPGHKCVPFYSGTVEAPK
jgi:hypothetical protein